MRKFLFSSLCSLIAFSAQAADKPTFSSSGPTQMGFGFSDTSNIGLTQSASALFSMGQDWVQANLTVGRTKGDVDFGAGGFYKHTMSGNGRNGFHFSPGFMVGTGGGSFAFGVVAGMGAHFTLAEHLMVSVDGGPMYTHTRNNSNFRILPIGELLGTSVHYLF